MQKIAKKKILIIAPTHPFNRISEICYHKVFPDHP